MGRSGGAQADSPSVRGRSGGAQADSPSVRFAILASLTRAFSLSPSGLRSTARPAHSAWAPPSLSGFRAACPTLRVGLRPGDVQAGRVHGPRSGLGCAEVPPAPADPSRSERPAGLCSRGDVQTGRVHGPHSGLGFAEVPPAPADPSRSERVTAGLCSRGDVQAGRVHGPHSGLGFAEVPPAPADPSRSERPAGLCSLNSLAEAS